MLQYFFLIVFAASVSANPVQFGHILPRATTNIGSFIALGESYGSGVGAGVSDSSVLRTRCPRFNQAYPRLLARDNGLPGPADESRLINNACSGQEIPKILATQFADQDSNDANNFKAFGRPQFATISAGGDDIEFKNLVLSCIYEFPYKPRNCQEQIARSDSILGSDTFFASIQDLIQTTLDKGRANRNDFRIYYLGYAQFFNVAATSPDFCSQKSWSLCKFWQRGCEKLPLDIGLRTQLNALATKLNFQIQAAVDSFKDTAQDVNGFPLVKFVDIDTIAEGHRYYEQGKQEPVNNDDDIWLFQWLDDETTNDDAKHEFYNELAQRFSNVPDIETFQDNTLSGNLVVSAADFLEGEVQVATTNTTLALDIQAESALINRVKTFHPKIPYHDLIEQRLRDLVNADYTPAQVCDFSAGSCDTFQESCDQDTESAFCRADADTGKNLCKCVALPGRF